MINGKTKRELGSRIIWVYSLPMLIAMILCFIAFTTYMRSFLYKTAYTESSKTLQRVSLHFEQRIHYYTEPFQKFHGKIAYKLPSNLRSVLSAEQKKNKVVDIYYGGADGSYVSARNLKRDPDHFEYRTKSWYLEPSRNKGLAYSGPTINYGAEKRVLTISLPIWKTRKRIQGVIAEDIDVNDFRSSLSALSKESGGITMLVNSESDSVYTYFPYQTSLGEITLDSIYSIFEPAKKHYSLDSIESSAVFSFEFEDAQSKRYTAMIAPLNKLPLHLVYIVPQNKTAALLREKSWNFMVFAGACVLILLVVASITSKILFRRMISKDLADSVNSSTLFDAILSSKYFSLILTDNQFRVLRASANIASASGDVDWHSLQGKNLWEIIPNPEFKDFVLNAQRTAAPQTSEIGQTQIVVQQKDGSIVWWNISFNLLIEDDASVRYLFLVSDETSAVRKDSILDSIMASSQNTIIIFDSELKISYVSNRIGDILGIDPAILIGKPYDEMTDFGVPQKILDMPISALESGSRWSANFELPLHDGRVIWCRGQGSVLLSKDSSSIGYLFFITDITPIIKAEQEAKDATKAKSEFLANMSHEIRTPMNAIIGMSDLALSTDLSPRQEHYIDRISYAAKSLLGIINNILDYSKIEAKKQEIEHIPFAIRECVSNVLSIAVVRIAGKPIELLADIDSRIPERVFGDPLHLSQILTNLINNAEKFTEKGQVVLKMELKKLENSKATIYTSVVDSGIGMTEEQAGKLFKMFAQADGSTTRKYGGTGLGLAISHSLVELMGGELQVKSQVNQGSEFYFTVDFDVVDRPISKGRTPLENKRILFAESNKASQEILRKMAAAMHVQADFANSAEEAYARFESNAETPYDGIVLAWTLSEMGALKLAKQMQNSGQKVPPLVAISKLNDEAHLKDAIENGFKRYLPKPFLLEDLQKTLEEALGFRVIEESKTRKPQKQNVYRFKPAKVLLVEDNALNQELAIELLNRVGLNIDVANNGAEGVEAVKKNSYALILMDLQMPVMDGFEATRQIRAMEDPLKKALPIIAMSARALRGDKEKSLAAGLNAHITKPIDPEEFYQELSHWLEQESSKESSELNPVEVAAIKDPFLSIFDKIPDFDAELGLYRSAGSKSIYFKVIRRFVEDFNGFVPKIQEMVQNKDYVAASRMAHTLKGILGTIGCAPLQEKFAKLEYTLSSNQEEIPLIPWTKLNDRLQKLIERLCKSIPLAAEVLGEREEALVEDPEAMTKLSKMLETIERPIHDAVPAGCRAALQLIEHIRYDECRMEWIKQLKKAVEDFDFETAESVVAELKKTL